MMPAAKPLQPELTVMTPENIEAAARRLCAVRGLDPDLQILQPGDSLAPVPPRSDYGPTWQAVAAEIRAHAALHAEIAGAS